MDGRITADEWATRLASGGRIAAPVAVVVAHADDETLFAGALLGRLERGLLIHLTDSAPRDMSDATRLGFATREAYAARRSAELDAALIALGALPARIGYGVPDQDSAERLDEIATRLAEDLRGAALVVTHAYEGGHPDHDAAACAVANAVGRIAQAGGQAPALVEFPSYALENGERVWARFRPNPACPEYVRAFDRADIAQVDAAVAAHASQAAVIGDWRPREERWRATPAYNFAAPPPSGAYLYDRFGWTMTSERWRARAAAMMVAA